MGPALGSLAASYAGCDKVLVASLFAVGMAFMGFFYPSLKVTANYNLKCASSNKLKKNEDQLHFTRA